jgi:hypothetical protein
VVEHQHRVARRALHQRRARPDVAVFRSFRPLARRRRRPDRRRVVAEAVAVAGLGVLARPLRPALGPIGPPSA